MLTTTLYDNRFSATHSDGLVTVFFFETPLLTLKHNAPITRLKPLERLAKEMLSNYYKTRQKRFYSPAEVSDAAGISKQALSNKTHNLIEGYHYIRTKFHIIYTEEGYELLVNQKRKPGE